jgi:hypothetical protein
MRHVLVVWASSGKTVQIDPSTDRQIDRRKRASQTLPPGAWCNGIIFYQGCGCQFLHGPGPIFLSFDWIQNRIWIKENMLPCLTNKSTTDPFNEKLPVPFSKLGKIYILKLEGMLLARLRATDRAVSKEPLIPYLCRQRQELKGRLCLYQDTSYHSQTCNHTAMLPLDLPMANGTVVMTVKRWLSIYLYLRLPTRAKRWCSL